MRASILAPVDTRRGRKSKWHRVDLLNIANCLKGIVARETAGRKGARSFVEHYLGILDFPDDVRAALEKGEINLFEAEQLARITPRRSGLTSSQARSRRERILQAHLASQESGRQLMHRVALVVEATANVPESENEPSKPVAERRKDTYSEGANGQGADDGLTYSDSRHLFFEHLTLIGRALRETEVEGLPEDVVDRLFTHGDEILILLQQINKRKEQQKTGFYI